MTLFLCKYRLLCLSFILMLCGCQPTLQHQTVTLSNGESVLTVYLNNDSHDTSLQLEQVELHSEGLWLSVANQTTQQTADNQQQLVALESLPQGAYDKIRFKLTIKGQRHQLLRTEQVVLPINNHLILKENGSQCLFINSLLEPHNLDRPLHTLLTAETQQAPLADNLLYVLCPNLSTLYIARTDNFSVTAAYPLPGTISDLEIDNSRRLVYLLDQRDQLIHRWDGISQQLTDRIPLPMTQSPEGLEISADGGQLYITDTINRQLLKIDARNGTVLSQITVGYKPSRPYWFHHDNQNRLALISRGDQQLHLFNADNLSSIATVAAGQQPFEVTYAENWLYVSDSFDHQLLQIDPDNGTLQAKIPTGLTPGALAVDMINRNVLIAQQDDASLALLPFGQQLLSRIIHAGAAPGDITISNNRRLLYIANATSNSISVLDLPSEKLINTITVGATPTVIAVQEQ